MRASGVDFFTSVDYSISSGAVLVLAVLCLMLVDVCDFDVDVVVLILSAGRKAFATTQVSRQVFQRRTELRGLRLCPPGWGCSVST